MAWLDTLARGRSLGRGVADAGQPCASRARVPPAPRHPGLSTQSTGPKGACGSRSPCPGLFLNRPFLTAFNTAFYRLSAAGASREGFAGFFYPFDRIGDWNLMYGRPGFLQYQCVIPDPRGEDGIAAALGFLSDNGLGAFLSVLKRCGDDHA